MNIHITLYTIPQVACDSKKMNWTQAGKMLHGHLMEHLGDQMVFLHTEFMSDQWFEDAEAQQIMEKENLNLPFVMINGESASTGPKIKLSQIVRKAKEIIQEKSRS